MTRTIEVVPKKSSPYGNHVGWTFSGTYWGSEVFDKKSKAVSEAKNKAKREASRKGKSIGLKIFGKDGEYQRQHVYDP